MLWYCFPSSFIEFRSAGCRKEVRNVLVIQTPGRLSVFQFFQKNQKLNRRPWDLASFQVSWNSVQSLHSRSWKCLSQSEARVAILVSQFPLKHKLYRGCWVIAFCQVSWNSIQGFQRRSQMSQACNQRLVGYLSFPNGPQKHKLGRGHLWNAKLTETQIFSELSTLLESSIIQIDLPL